MLNIEIKAHTAQPQRIHDLLKELKAEFKGVDHQIDTYFRVSDGRLKLRQGNIENSLIFYQRPDQAGPKASSFLLYHPATAASDSLKNLLTTALGKKVVVDKKRAIYFLDNIKFHIDEVEGLGNFVEIEVMDTKNTNDIQALEQQCKKYMQLFDIKATDLLNGSYSDMIQIDDSRDNSCHF